MGLSENAKTFNAETKFQSRTVPEVFSQASRRWADRTAFRYKELGIWKEVSWKQYYRRVRCLMAGMMQWGVARGDRVALLGENCHQWVTVDVAGQCLGAIPVGIYATSSWQQCRYYISHSQSNILFLQDEEQLDKWLHFKTECPDLERVVIWDAGGLGSFSDPQLSLYSELFEMGCRRLDSDPEAIDRSMAEVEPDDTAVLIYTSGTTGAPKGAMLSHRNVTWMPEAIRAHDPENQLNQEDELLSFLPLCHIFERLFSVFSHLAFGYTVNFVENPETVATNLREVSPTVGYGVPRVWEKYASNIKLGMEDASWLKRKSFDLALKISRARLDSMRRGDRLAAWQRWLYRLAESAVLRKLRERLGFERMRVAWTGAAPIAPEVLGFFHQIGLQLLEGYGQTESTGVISSTRRGSVRPGSVGQPLPGVEVRIAGDGEILARSAGVFQGYFRDPEKTAETIDPKGWLHTGDVGEIDRDGFVRIVDRKKDIMITAGGKNIAPQLLENKLKFSPYIYDSIVIGEGRKFLSALIVLDEDNIAKFAQDKKLAYSTYSDLARNPEIQKLIQKEVDRVNRQVSRVENIRRFRILPRRLYEEDGEVTPTLKVKRQMVSTLYAELVESMYAEP